MAPLHCRRPLVPLLVLALSILAAPPASTPAHATTQPLRVERADAAGLRLALHTPDVVQSASGTFSLPGVATTSDPATGLPLILAPILLPAPITPTLTVRGMPEPLGGKGPGTATRLPAARVLRLLMVRDATVAVVALAPVQWDGQRLTHTPQLTVDVAFGATAMPAAAVPPAAELSGVLAAVALNQLTPASIAQAAPSTTTATTKPAPDVLVRVESPGVVTVTGSQLAALGWPLDTVIMASVRLSHQGQPLAYESNTAVIDPLAADTTIRFAVPPGWSRYTDAIGLRLSIEPGADALREAAPESTPFAFGQPTRYTGIYAGPALGDERVGDHFFAAAVSAEQPSATLPFTLPASLPPGSLLVVGLQAESLDTEAEAELRVDGGSLLETRLRGPEPSAVTLTLSSALAAGPHSLQLSHRRGAGLLLDRAIVPELRLPLPAVVPTLQVAPPTLKEAPAEAIVGADLLVMTHALFREALAPLVAMHQARGRRVALVDVQAAYDSYGDGTLSPEAIRSYLRDAAPKAVLLVGDGTWDFKNYLGHPARTFVPPYLEQIDGKLGEASCDTCYARWSTATPAEDTMPDALVGRLSVETAAEAQTLVAKIVRYNTRAPAGSWRGTHLFVADNSYERDGTPDKTVAPGKPTFDAAADAALALLPQGQTGQRFYFEPRPSRLNLPGSYADAARLRTAMFAAWNGGAAVINYVGHSNYYQWAVADPQAGVPYLYGFRDAALLSNGGRLPMLLSMSCLNGLFQEPGQPTTDEGLLRKADGGIIAAVSSSGLGVASGHDALHHGLLTALVTEHQSVGAAQLAGFTSLLTTAGCCTDLAYTYQLLGDPLSTLPSGPAATQLFVPLIRR